MLLDRFFRSRRQAVGRLRRFKKAAAEAFSSFCSRLFYPFSPRNNLINHRPLLFRGPRQINPCSLNAVMPHQICQQRNIVKSGQKILCEPMPERVGVDSIRVDPVTPGQHLQLPADPAGGKRSAVSVGKHKAGLKPSGLQPVQRVPAQRFRKINPADLSAL